MAIIYQKDKRCGIVYAYESKSYWDKEKKQSRAKRTLIGRLDESSGEIVPTDGRGRKAYDPAHGTPRAKARAQKNKVLSSKEVKRSFYGATYLFDAIGEKIGITEDLKRIFPDTYRQILSIAYYLILEENNPLSRFEKWSTIHHHPHGEPIASQRSSELFASVTEANRQHFFTLQSKRRAQEEYWAYDTTSISSYSQQLSQVQYGHSKEDDTLPQINLALVFGETSNLPFYYRKLPGNMPDVMTVKRLLSDFRHQGIPKVKLVMDRGFFSKENVTMLYQNHQKFLLSPRIGLRFIQKHLEPLRPSFRSFEQYDTQYALYGHTVRTTWDYEETRSGENILQSKRVYLHYYYNIERAAEDEQALNQKLATLREELISNQRVEKHTKLYEKYFTVHTTPKRGTKVALKEEEIEKARQNYGYFALMSNITLDAVKALEVYRNKDVVEKAFGNLKERLNMRRLLVSSEQSLDGKLFVEFVALIYLSYIKKQMQVKGLFKDYTLQGLLDAVDVIECFEYPGKRMEVGEVLKKQKEIYKAMEVKVLE